MSNNSDTEEPPSRDNDHQRNNRIPQLVRKLRGLLGKGSPLLGHVLIVILLIGGTVLISYSLSTRAESLAKEWSSNLRPARNPKTDLYPYAPIHRNIVPYINISEGAKERLQNQLNDIRNRAAHHLEVATFYYARYYMAIVAFSMAAGFAAIFLASISRVGLKESSPYLVTAFVVMTAMALFYQSFPGVFDQKKNIETNKALYIRYVNLEDEVNTYCATGEITIPTKANSSGGKSNETGVNNKSAEQDSLSHGTYKIITAQPDEFIHYVDYQLQTYNDIAIGFDESKAASFAKEQFQSPK
jgi:hypothetical protein